MEDKVRFKSKTDRGARRFWYKNIEKIDETKGEN